MDRFFSACCSSEQDKGFWSQICSGDSIELSSVFAEGWIQAQYYQQSCPAAALDWMACQGALEQASR
jgi:hypothetical protein